MNHLQEAKKLNEYQATSPVDEDYQPILNDHIRNHALIAIAEQLEIMNRREEQVKAFDEELRLRQEDK